MTTVKYKGFAILAQPYQLHESKRWTVELEIWRHGRKQHFSLKDNYRTEQEADTRCSGVGQCIIDGNVRGFSVNHLRVRKSSSLRWFIVAGVVILGLSAFVGSVEWPWMWDWSIWGDWI
jgi:hypothetical protein